MIKETIKSLLVYIVGVLLGVYVVMEMIHLSSAIQENSTMLRELLDKEPEVQVQTKYVLLIKDEDERENVDTAVEVMAEEAIEPVDEVQEVTETVGKTIGQNVQLPDLPTDRKVCTNYKVYNIAGTPHNRMQLLARTDEQGCRRYGEHYIVGLGSAYADRIGEVFEIELDTGVTFTVITGDMKADKDTDPTNRFGECYNYDGEYCANILEFIVDTTAIDVRAYRWGGVDYYPNFKGNIVRMTYLGRDASEDWDTYE